MTVCANPSQLMVLPVVVLALLAGCGTGGGATRATPVSPTPPVTGTISAATASPPATTSPAAPATPPTAPPSSYRVAFVASNDVLEAHATGSVDSPTVARLPFDATGVRGSMSSSSVAMTGRR